MTTRRRVLATTGTVAATALSGCLGSTPDETDPEQTTPASGDPEYDLELDCQDWACEFTVTLDSLGTAEYLRVEYGWGQSKTLTTETPEVTVESESITVYSVSDDIKTRIGHHERIVETDGPSANPQAGVTFDQEREVAPETYKVSVQVISMENSDYVQVIQGDYTSERLSSVGETVTVTDLSKGDAITVIGSLDGTRAELQTYTVA